MKYPCTPEKWQAGRVAEGGGGCVERQQQAASLHIHFTLVFIIVHSLTRGNAPVRLATERVGIAPVRRVPAERLAMPEPDWNGAMPET